MGISFNIHINRYSLFSCISAFPNHILHCFLYTLQGIKGCLRKSKDKDNVIEAAKTHELTPEKETVEIKEEKVLSTPSARKSTSISSSCNISGDLVLDEDIQIFGHIKGSVRSNDGIVTIQKKGLLKARFMLKPFQSTAL